MLVTPSLKLWLRMEGNANDSSGNGNNGTVHGASLATGKFGKCYSFDGVDDYISVLDSASLNIIDEITIEAWIKAISFPLYSNMVEKNQTGGYKLGLHNNNIMFTLYDLWDAESVGTISANVWSHIVTTYNRSQVKIYINSNLDTTISKTDQIGTGTSPVIIGKRGTSTNESLFDGLIDEVRIYNRALSAEDVKRVYLGLHPL